MTHKFKDTIKSIEGITSGLMEMAKFCDEKFADKKEIMDRLAYIFNDDADLAKTVYDYVFRGHLSYFDQLRDRFKPIARKKKI